MEVACEGCHWQHPGKSASSVLPLSFFLSFFVLSLICSLSIPPGILASLLLPRSSSVQLLSLPPSPLLPSLPLSLPAAPHWCVLILSYFFSLGSGPIGRLPSNHYLYSSTPLSSFLPSLALPPPSHLSSRKNDLHAGAKQNFAVSSVRELREKSGKD